MHVFTLSFVADRALALMYQLQNTLLPEMDSMLAVLDLCAQLDWSVEYSWHLFHLYRFRFAGRNDDGCFLFSLNIRTYEVKIILMNLMQL